MLANGDVRMSCALLLQLHGNYQTFKAKMNFLDSFHSCRIFSASAQVKFGSAQTFCGFCSGL